MSCWIHWKLYLRTSSWAKKKKKFNWGLRPKRRGFVSDWRAGNDGRLGQWHRVRAVMRRSWYSTRLFSHLIWRQRRTECYVFERKGLLRILTYCIYLAVYDHVLLNVFVRFFFLTFFLDMLRYAMVDNEVSEEQAVQSSVSLLWISHMVDLSA